MRVRECRTQTTVLHADLDADRLAFSKRKTSSSCREIAQHQTKSVMQHDNREDQCTGLGNRDLVDRNHSSDNQNNADDRHQRQHRNCCLHKTWHQLLQNEAKRKRHEDNLEDADKHAHRIDGKVLAGKKPDEKRRDNRCKQGCDAGASNTERNIAFAEIGHHIACSATRTTANKNYACSNFR